VENFQASDRRVCCQKTCGKNQVLQKRAGYERELIKGMEFTNADLVDRGFLCLMFCSVSVDL